MDPGVPAAALPAEVRETHSGLVVLVGEHAYKVKKPVDLGFLDFTSVAARWEACRREVRLNRRIAPDVYGGVASFTRPEGGEPEPVVVMRRMPDRLRLSTLVAQGADVGDHLRSLARLVAAFHARAECGPAIAHEGGAARTWHRWRVNLAEAAQLRTDSSDEPVLDESVLAEIGRLALCFVDGRRRLFAARAAAGLVVDGHGDLIADDVFCLSDHPRVLDCLDFDDRLRSVDVLDDVAFLAMDLERLGRPDLAARFLALYAEFAASPQPVSLAHHFVAYRAFVRAKVAAIRAGQGSAPAAAEARGDAELALRHLRDGEVRLVLVGGAPGTGKTTLAAALADELGLAHVATDEVRRELDLGTDRYTPRAKDAVYGGVLERAQRALELGGSVVADATWTDPGWRAAAAQVAVRTRSRLTALECVAPVELAASRAERRHARGADASEADAAVSRALAGARQPWPQAHPVDTSGPPERALAEARALLAGGRAL